MTLSRVFNGNIKIKLAASLVIIFFLSFYTLQADINIEMGINSGYTDNLISDSSSIEDRYITHAATIKYYPLPIAELVFSGEHTYYDEIFNLSNTLTGASFSIVPLRADIPVSLYLSGSIFAQRYAWKFQGYNNDKLSLHFGTGWKIIPNYQIRAGVKIQNTGYLDSDPYDQKAIEFFGGFNTSDIYKNSFDLELGYGEARYSDLSRDVFDYLDIYDSMLVKKDLYSFYISPRISRPLGGKTGINLVFTHRSFSNADSALVFGATNQNLSPWASVWDGHSVTSTIKTYLLPGFIITSGIGYWEKKFLRTLEEGMYSPNQIGSRDDARKDFQSRFYVKFQHPFTLKTGQSWEPSIQIEYSDNNSTNEVYNYTNFAISIGIMIKP